MGEKKQQNKQNYMWLLFFMAGLDVSEAENTNYFYDLWCVRGRILEEHCAKVLNPPLISLCYKNMIKKRNEKGASESLERKI